MPNNFKYAKSLLPHEYILLCDGKLHDKTHARASSVWLTAPSWTELNDNHLDFKNRTLMYRVMGDTELMTLASRNVLPSTQAYQSIQEGAPGRIYSEKYLKGHKFVATNPTTVVEFRVPRPLVTKLFKIQQKIEDGCISHGLGRKAGKTLPMFNEGLANGDIEWRIVTVKRKIMKRK